MFIATSSSCHLLHSEWESKQLCWSSKFIFFVQVEANQSRVITTINNTWNVPSLMLSPKRSLSNNLISHIFFKASSSRSCISFLPHCSSWERRTCGPIHAAQHKQVGSLGFITQVSWIACVLQRAKTFLFFLLLSQTSPFSLRRGLKAHNGRVKKILRVWQSWDDSCWGHLPSSKICDRTDRTAANNYF